jgi:hypothetical protein
MCPPIVGTVLSVGGTLLKAGSEVKAGQERKREADERAKQVELDNRMSEVEAKQKSRDMILAYTADTNANDAFFSYLGIDDSESIKAFNRKQKSIILEQELRMKTQDALRSARSKTEAASLRRSGANALAAAQIGALTTIVSGGADYMNVRGTGSSYKPRKYKSQAN